MVRITCESDSTAVFGALLSLAEGRAAVAGLLRFSVFSLCISMATPYLAGAASRVPRIFSHGCFFFGANRIIVAF